MKPWVQTEGVARRLVISDRDATPSELRFHKITHNPRVAKTQPWAEIRERLQR